MNPLLQCKPTILPLFIAGVLACFGLLPKALAVVPPPDGGYPGQNTAEGQSALLHLAGGTYNTALGWASLGFNVTGNYNTGVGAATLLNNTASENTATGAGALLNNTEGDFNTANGAFALFSNTTGERNTAIGDSALFFNTQGNRNTAVGNAALLHNTKSSNDNIAIGAFALRNNTESDQNTAVGSQALSSNTTGRNNTAIGAGALFNNIQGNNNIAIGPLSLSDATGFGNIALGFDAGAAITTASNIICIGDNLDGANVSNSCYIGHIWSQPGGSQAVYVNSDGKLGAQVSSRRFKDEIKPMEQTSEVIYGLKPVSFRYKPEIEPTRLLGFGLIAEEVEKVNPDLVSRDKDGKVNSVRYDAINAMLLNEFLKEHCKNEEQAATIARLEQQVEILIAGLQKVSAQLEAASPTVADLE